MWCQGVLMNGFSWHWDLDLQMFLGSEGISGEEEVLTGEREEQ